MEKNNIARILWVDDDVNDIKFLLYPLEKEGCKIEKCAYLPEAYDILLRNRTFDLIVLDLLMPPNDRYGDIPEWLKNDHPNGANGIKLLIQIRETLDIQIPVLIFSVVPDAIQEMKIGNKYDPLTFIHKSTHEIDDAINKIHEILKSIME